MRQVSYARAEQAITAVIYICQRAGLPRPVIDALLEAKRAAVRERPDQESAA